MNTKKTQKSDLLNELNLNLNSRKTLPYSLEAEQSILGGLIIDNEKIDLVLEKLVETDFFNYSHRLIYLEIQKLFNKKKPIDLITLSESLEKNGKLIDIGGFSYLAELAKNTLSSANINFYVEIVYEKSIIRNIITTSKKILELAYYPNGKNCEELIDLAESYIFKISKNYSLKYENIQNIQELSLATIKTIKKICQGKKNEMTGISTGYKDLDKKILGLQNSDLIIIASRPSMGKTTFAINLCEYIAIKEEKPVLIFSLEMPANQIMIRIISSLSRIDQMKIRTGNLNEEDWIRINNTLKILNKKKNMFIDDSNGLTPNEIRSRSRKLYREYGGLSLIMIDYLQLMRVPSISENRTLEISEISRSLKSLAKELCIPIIALSQLNRSLEQRSDKRPINSDLRDSGSIEQDADLIMFIYRDEIYNNTKQKSKGVAEIIISKQRNGPIGRIKLTFNAKWSRFDNYTENKPYYN